MRSKADVGLSQLSLLHETKNKNRKIKKEKLKTKTHMFRINGQKRVYGGKNL